MPLESGNFIPDLDANNPLGSDPKSEGDDHLRLIKRSTQGSFPGFVGTTAVPKSVSLTEDQINDAALKNEAQTITGPWTIDNSLILTNNKAYQGTESDNVTTRTILILTNSDEVKVGNANLPTILRGANVCQIEVDGALQAEFIPRAIGALQIRDRGNVYKLAAFRNPTRTQQGVSYTVLQNMENSLQRVNGNNVVITIPTLEAGTSILFEVGSNSGTQVVADAGITQRWYDGSGSLKTANTRSIAGASVFQIIFESASAYSIFGNGIS